LTFKAKAKDSKFVLEDTSRPRTKAKDNNTDFKHTLFSYRYIVHRDNTCKHDVINIQHAYCGLVGSDCKK